MSFHLSDSQYSKIVAILESIEDRESWHADYTPDATHNDKVIRTLVRYAMAGAASYHENAIAVKLASIIVDDLDKDELDFVSSCVDMEHKIQSQFRGNDNE
jgi:hypothetical protein